MGRTFTFEGAAGSYDGPKFLLEITPLLTPYIPYVQTSPDGSLLIVEVPDDTPAFQDAVISRRASIHAYNNTTIIEQAEIEKHRRKTRRKEALARVRYRLDELKYPTRVRKPEDTDGVLELLYDILKDEG